MRVLRAVKAHPDAGFKVFLSDFQNSPIENNMYFCYLGLLEQKASQWRPWGIRCFDSHGPGDCKLLLFTWSPSSFPWPRPSKRQPTRWAHARTEHRRTGATFNTVWTETFEDTKYSSQANRINDRCATWSLPRRHSEDCQSRWPVQDITWAHSPAGLLANSCWMCPESQPLVSRWRDHLTGQRTWRKLEDYYKPILYKTQGLTW